MFKRRWFGPLSWGLFQERAPWEKGGGIFHLTKVEALLATTWPSGGRASPVSTGANDCGRYTRGFSKIGGTPSYRTLTMSNSRSEKLTPCDFKSPRNSRKPKAPPFLNFKKVYPLPFIRILCQRMYFRIPSGRARTGNKIPSSLCSRIHFLITGALRWRRPHRAPHFSPPNPHASPTHL